jgi:hypothetical protein
MTNNNTYQFTSLLFCWGPRPGQRGAMDIATVTETEDQGSIPVRENIEIPLCIIDLICTSCVDKDK